MNHSIQTLSPSERLLCLAGWESTELQKAGGAQRVAKESRETRQKTKGPGRMGLGG